MLGRTGSPRRGPQPKTPRAVVQLGPAIKPLKEERVNVTRLASRLDGVQPLLKQVQAVLLEAPSEDKAGAAGAIQRRRQRALDSVKSLAQTLAGLNTDLESLGSTGLGAGEPRQRASGSARPSFTGGPASQSQLQSALSEAQSAREQQGALSAELDSLRTLVSRSQQEVGELSSALQAASSDAESRAQAAAQAESRAAGLEAELQAALGASQAGEQAVSKARSQADRHQEAVARLTGENLVLMLKLRQSEGAALQAASQRDAFARQLEQQKAPWFDQVQEGMQERVSGLLSQIASLEAQLEAQQASALGQAASSSAEAASLRAELQQAEGHAAGLQEQLSATQHTLDRTRQDHSQSQEGMRAAVRAQDEASAENRILLQTNHALQEETRISKAQLETAEVKNQVQQQLQDQLHEELQGLRMQLDTSLAACARQQQVNEQLMAAKTQVEWQLLEAKAHVKDGPSFNTKTDLMSRSPRISAQVV